VPALPDDEGSPADFFPLPTRAVRIEDRPLPGIEVHVLASPGHMASDIPRSSCQPDRRYRRWRSRHRRLA
jgi:hypothetical protein